MRQGLVGPVLCAALCALLCLLAAISLVDELLHLMHFRLRGLKKWNGLDTLVSFAVNGYVLLHDILVQFEPLQLGVYLLVRDLEFFLLCGWWLVFFRWRGGIQAKEGWRISSP